MNRGRPPAGEPRRVVTGVRILRKEIVAVSLPNGRPGVAELPVTADSMTPALCEGIRRHRALALEGRCPCGATPRPTRRHRREMKHGLADVPIRHDRQCPAHDDVLGPAVAAWVNGTA